MSLYDIKIVLCTHKSVGRVAVFGSAVYDLCLNCGARVPPPALSNESIVSAGTDAQFLRQLGIDPDK